MSPNMDTFCMRRRRAEKAVSLIGDEPELTHCRKAYPAMRLTKMMVRVSSSRSMAGTGEKRCRADSGPVPYKEREKTGGHLPGMTYLPKRR